MGVSDGCIFTDSDICDVDRILELTAIAVIWRRKRGEMGNDYKGEARKEYLRYFRVWFIIVGILAVLAAGRVGVRLMADNAPRENNSAPTERVYDYANVLTDDEEEKLRNQIAKAEKRLRMDIVIVTFNESVEGEEAAEKFGSPYWEDNMQTLADDFWDEKGYGYNKNFEGDGMLILHNWYEGQNGEHLSTSGKAEWSLTSRDIDRLLDRVDRYYDTNLYRAYSEFVKAVVETFDDSIHVDSSYWLGAAFLSTIAAIVYAAVGLSHTKAKDTTAVNAYVVDGKPNLTLKRDDFIRKQVTKHHIERSSSGGSGGRSSGGGGGGGHHTSSSGASHGGGSHRH